MISCVGNYDIIFTNQRYIYTTSYPISNVYDSMCWNSDIIIQKYDIIYMMLYPMLDVHDITG